MTRSEEGRTSRASPRAARGSAASSPGRRRARSAPVSSTALSVPSGSNRRRSTYVEPSGRPDHEVRRSPRSGRAARRSSSSRGLRKRDLVETAPRSARARRAGALGALRGPGGARGEDDEAARLVGRRSRSDSSPAGDQLLERRVAGAPRPRRSRRRTAATVVVDAREQAGELLVVDQRLRPLAVDHLVELRARRTSCSGRARWRRAWQRRASPRRSRGGCGHMIATPSPSPIPIVGEGLGRARWSGGAARAKRERAALVDDRDLVRVA